MPAKRYEFGEWRKAKVHPDYHIEVARAYYSVPYRLIGERVDVRLTRRVRRPEKHIAVIDQHLDRVLEISGWQLPYPVTLFLRQCVRATIQWAPAQFAESSPRC